jgi:hypothetical protein
MQILLRQVSRARLTAFGDGRPAEGLPEAVRGRARAQAGLPTPSAEKPATAAADVTARDAAHNSGMEADSPRVGPCPLIEASSLGGGIDKSVLAFSEPRRIRDMEHLRFVAAQACLVCGRQPSDAHHLRFAQPRALSRKVSDEFTVPLCRIHHREVHRGGSEEAWWNTRGIDPQLVAAALWAQTRPGRSVAEVQAYDLSSAPPAARSEPAPRSRLPNSARNRKTKPIIGASAQ